VQVRILPWAQAQVAEMARHQCSVAACSPANNLPAGPDRSVIEMGKLNVKNGTPVGGTHLCKSCSWGQFVIGYRESDLMVICTNTNPNIIVPFTVYECSGYNDKHKPTYEQMKKLAVDFQPLRISKTKGFCAVETVHPVRQDDEDEDEDEVALGR
jgi:hypothetical protein